MRKTLLASAIVLFATIAMAQGRNDGRTPFVTSVEAPKLERILPPPPGITDSRFYDDWSQYQWGLSMRATERGLQARSDAFLNASYFMARFSPAMGHAVTQEANPQLFLLLQRAHATEMVSNASASRRIITVCVPISSSRKPRWCPSMRVPPTTAAILRATPWCRGSSV